MLTCFLTDSSLQSLCYLLHSHELFYETKRSLSAVKATFAYFSAGSQLGSSGCHQGIVSSENDYLLLLNSELFNHHIS